MKQKAILMTLSLCFILVCVTGTHVTTTVQPVEKTSISLGTLDSMSGFNRTSNPSNYELLVQTNNTLVTLQPANLIGRIALFDCYVTATISDSEGVQIASERMDVLAPTSILLNISRGAYDIRYCVEGITNEVHDIAQEVRFDIKITQSPELCTQWFGVAHGTNPANGSLLTVLNTNYSCVTDNSGFCTIAMPKGAMYIAHADNVTDRHFWTCEEQVLLLRWK